MNYYKRDRILDMLLQKFLTALDNKKFSPRTLFWFSLSMTFAASFGLEMLQVAFSHEYSIAEDARQHLFWMQRFKDPELFPQDAIADFFQSIAPPGTSIFYQLMDKVGIEPILLSKILPIVLGLITTWYCFAVCMEILPIPAVGFVSSLLLNQALWLSDDLTIAASRAFLYPTFMAFLYYLLRRSWLGVSISMALVGVCYPPLMLVAAGILIMRSLSRKEYLLCGVGLGVALLVSVFYLIQSSEFGPTISVAEARTMPEFFAGGRMPFFLTIALTSFGFKLVAVEFGSH